MKPTENEIDELLKFIPLLSDPGFSPIKNWKGGKKPDGTIQLGYPEYHELTEEFYGVVTEFFTCQYDPVTAGSMIKDPSFISKADLNQVMQMLTFCVRGERFCDGHWASMIEEGYIQNLLERLAQLKETSK